jgi:hypothetical protein
VTAVYQWTRGLLSVIPRGHRAQLEARRATADDDRMTAVSSTARRCRRLIVAAAIAAGVLAQPAAAAPLPQAPNCPLFPRTSPWNQPVDKLPVAAGSRRIVNGVGAGAGVHNNFGPGLWWNSPDGMPYVVVGGDQPRVPVSFVEGPWSDPGPYPIPPNAPIEYVNHADADHHVIVVDRDSCRLYEMYDSTRLGGGGSWKAYAGATWDLRSAALRPNGWTSADGAGLPILPGLARYDEVKRGRIDHALRITVPRTSSGWVYPARHDVTNAFDPSLPQMGMRVRLRKSFDVSRFPRQSRVILTALKKYGAIVADQGGAWYVSGEPNPGWSYDDLHQMEKVLGRNFEVVDTSSLPRPGE